MVASTHVGARLVYVDDTGVKRSIPLAAGGMTIGRARDNALSFPRNDGVSRYHAEVVLHEGQFVIVDRGSSGGTFVNDTPVQEHTLQDGDIIQLGPRPAPVLAFRGLEQGGTDAMLPEVSETPDEPLTVIAPGNSLFLNPELLKQAGKETRNLEERMKALYQVTSAFLQVESVEEVCSRLLDMIFEILPADRGAVLLRSGPDGELVQRASRLRALPQQGGFAPSRTITARVARENVAVLSLDASVDDRFAQGKSVLIQSIRSVMCAPISSVDEVFGVCYLDTVIQRQSFEEDDLELLVAVCRQAAMALENLHLLDEQKRTFESMVRALAHSIDARDGITAGHSSRVAKYSQAIARYMGMTAQEAKRIWYAGLLHDYGKIGTREAVLCKAGALTPEEYEHIKEHPKHTFRILSNINFASDMTDLPLVASSHHERPDGKGYPNGLKGKAIPLGGLIIGVADFFDALTVKRHYREPMPLDQVVELLQKGRDTQFDGTVLNAFLRYFEREYLPFAKRMAERRSQAAVTPTDGPTEALKVR